MKKEVATLSGKELDYWVAKAEGYSIDRLDGRDDILALAKGGVVLGVIRRSSVHEYRQYATYQPTRDWAQGGPIIARAGIQSSPRDVDYSEWVAGKAWGNKWGDIIFRQYGRTLLEAAMRCYVATRFGETVEDDDANPGLSEDRPAKLDATAITPIATDREDAWL